MSEAESISVRVIDGQRSFTISAAAEELVHLRMAMARAGREPTGYAIEEVLYRLMEIGDPPWANEIAIDAESDLCSVSSSRKSPLVHVLQRLHKRLANPRRLRWMLNATALDD